MLLNQDPNYNIDKIFKIFRTFSFILDKFVKNKKIFNKKQMKNILHKPNSLFYKKLNKKKNK